ncbi:MAG: DUF72 domain-containing protein [Candidatus Bathyarchaeota archaeon]|nr:MAG: DUF72 domain-containing protein [Candidatus Bathyarchaeota archaeon]
MAQLVFGTSGWSYKEWIGPFYEKAAKKFSYYTRFFNTAEINSTFYSYPSRAMLYGLYRASPSNFLFSAKLPRVITHQNRLNPEQKVKNHLLRFLELLHPLKAGGKLGCLLIQLPPSFTYERDLENLKAFFEMLPDEYEFAVEFRNHSWLKPSIRKLLKTYNVAYCIVDEPLLPPEVYVTADFAYFRWHGRGTQPWYDYHYSEEELEEWVPRIEKTRDQVRKVYGYFNNHYHGYAVENCIQILEMLQKVTSEQERIKEKIIQYNLHKRPQQYGRRLEEFQPTVHQLSVTQLLQELTDPTRLDRGQKIGDEECKVEDSSEETIRSTIRNYSIELNLKDKVLTHDCDDWVKGVGIKRLCKHVVKLFLLLPRDRSETVLRNMLITKADWQFQS